MVSPEQQVPQDRPHDRLSSKSPYGGSDGAAGSNTSTTAGPSANNVNPPPMQHDLEVAQACLNLRQESKASADPQTRSGLAKDGTSSVGGMGPNGATDESSGAASNRASPPKSHIGMDSRSGAGMGSAMLPPMPPIPQGEAGREGGGPPGPAGRPGMSMQQMPGGPYMGVPSQIEFSGPNGLPPGVKEMHPYYSNMVDGNGGGGAGHFYPQFPSEEQYHAMMNGMGAMREMSYYNMMGGNQSDGPNMMGPNHFFPSMMPHEGGHFNAMMGSYPPGGPYMQQPKRPHPDDGYSMQNDFKRNRTASPHDKPPEENPVRTKKVPDKPKKGKRASDMPRRPLSAYNFFFSEERERILAAIPDPDEEDGKKSPSSSPEKVNKENSQNESNEEEEEKEKGIDEASEISKLSKEEMAEKMAARSKRLLALREQQTNKRRPHRKTHGKIGFKELVKKIGERWRALPSDQRQYYASLAETDLKRYKEQMTEYNNKLTHTRN